MSALDTAEAFAHTHRNALLAGGAVAATGAALIVKRRTKNATGPTAQPAGTATGYGAETTGAGPYDSTAFDVYDAIEPQLAGLSDQIGKVSTNATSYQTSTSKRIADLSAAIAKLKTPKPAPRRSPPPTIPKRTPAPAHPTTKSKTYTVRAGDSLSAIAARLGVKGGWQALYTANRKTVGANPNQIKVGQRLTVPG